MQGPSSGMLPRVIKYLLILNVGIFLLDFLTKSRAFYNWFALMPELLIGQFQIWRLFTYMFVHSQESLIHILFNMLMLWMFGTPLLAIWSEKKFLYFYFAAGLFAGVCSFIFYGFMGPGYHLVGASGAIFGLMFAFAKYFPTQRFLLFFLFPVEARYAVLIIGGIELLLITSQDGIAHVTHLGGALFAWVYCRYEIQIERSFWNFKQRKHIAKQRKQDKEDRQLDETMLDIDPILKKISEHGIQSLSGEERKKLEKASELRRQRKGNVIDLDEYRRKR